MLQRFVVFPWEHTLQSGICVDEMVPQCPCDMDGNQREQHGPQHFFVDESDLFGQIHIDRCQLRHAKNGKDVDGFARKLAHGETADRHGQDNHV